MFPRNFLLLLPLVKCMISVIIIAFSFAFACDAFSQSADSAFHFSLGSPHAGIGFGSLPNYNGIKFGVDDVFDEQINGISLGILSRDEPCSPSRPTNPSLNGIAFHLINTHFESCNGVALCGLAELSESVNGISLGLFGDFGKIRNGILGGLLFTGATKMNGIAISAVDLFCDTANGIQLASALGVMDKIPAHLANGLAFGFWAVDIEAVNGLSYGLLYNGVSDTHGIQIGGVTRPRNAAGFVAGVYNLSRDSVTSGITGLIVGVFNRLQRLNGVQIGFLNHTKELHGIQVGILNHAENALLPWFPFINIVL